MKTIIMQQDERGVYVDSGVLEIESGSTFKFIGSMKARDIGRGWTKIYWDEQDKAKDHIHDCGYDAEWMPRRPWPFKEQRPKPFEMKYPNRPY